MLDTQFLRPLGDAGNPNSWPFPVIIERVDGAFAQPVVSGAFEEIELFIDAGRRLVDRSACAVVTTCGFLVRHQRALQLAIAVPVRTSTLLSYGALRRKLGGSRQVAILTISKAALNSTQQPRSTNGFVLPSPYREPTQVLAFGSLNAPICRRIPAPSPKQPGCLFMMPCQWARPFISQCNHDRRTCRLSRPIL